jgi:hypothetical protein
MDLTKHIDKFSSACKCELACGLLYLVTESVHTGEKRGKMYKKFFAIILLALFTSACASQQAAFVSTPPGAQVYIDGKKIGVTPCSYDYKLSQNASHEVTIAKNGFEPVNFVVVTDEVDTKARNRWMVAGAVWSPLWLGTLFTKKLKDGYDFALRAEPTEMTATANQTVPDEKL